MKTVAFKKHASKSVKPAFIAYVNDRCTGCGGAPVCLRACKNGALELEWDTENYPLKRMRVNPFKCTGCGACVSRGDNGILTTGCPWDAIRLMPVICAMGRSRTVSGQSAVNA
jgi:ferredoxin